MSIVGLIILLIVIGVLLPFITPMDARAKQLIYVVLGLVVVVWLLVAVGLIPGGALHGPLFR